MCVCRLCMYVHVQSICMCVCYAYMCVCVCCLCASACGLLWHVCVIARSTLHVSQCHVVAHTHTYISMQTCCGFCVRVRVCVCVADMKYLFAALLAFCFFDIRFFCHFCFRSLTQSPYLPLCLSLSQHGVLITLS